MTEARPHNDVILRAENLVKDYRIGRYALRVLHGVTMEVRSNPSIIGCEKRWEPGGLTIERVRAGGHRRVAASCILPRTASTRVKGGFA